MREWTTLITALTEEHKLPPDSSVLHCESSIGLIVANFIEASTRNEVSAYVTDPIEWRVTSDGGVLYLVHSVADRSWIETPVEVFEHEDSWVQLLDTRSTDLDVFCLLIDATDNSLLVARQCKLSLPVLEELKRGIRRQRTMGPDALLEAHRLRNHELELSESAIPLNPQHRTSLTEDCDEPRPQRIMRTLMAKPTSEFQYYEREVNRLKAPGLPLPWRHCFYPVEYVQDREEDRLQSFLRNSRLHEVVTDQDEDDEWLVEAPEHASAYTALLLNWRQKQGVYRFDADLLKAITSTALPTRYPPSVLANLPDYCVYVETPSMRTPEGARLYGFFAMTEGVDTFSDSGGVQEDLRTWVLLDSELQPPELRAKILTFSLNTRTLGEALTTLKEVTDAERLPRLDLLSWVEPLIAQLLYLSSIDPEMCSHGTPFKSTTDLLAPVSQTSQPSAPNQVTVWECGLMTGLAVRLARKGHISQHQDSQTNEHQPSFVGSVRRASWQHVATDADASGPPRVKYLPLPQ